MFSDTAMGVDMNALHNGESDYVKAVYQVKEAIAVVRTDLFMCKIQEHQHQIC